MITVLEREDVYEYLIFLSTKSRSGFFRFGFNHETSVRKNGISQVLCGPIIDRHGKYVGTLTEGDLLWQIKYTDSFTLELAEQIQLKEIQRKMKNKPVRINSKMTDLLTLAISQNFIPVVDDHGIFIGIIRRREIIEYYANLVEKENDQEDNLVN